MSERITYQPESTNPLFSPEQPNPTVNVPDTIGSHLEMTPLSPRGADSAETAPRSVQERLVFVHPEDNRRQFEIKVPLTHPSLEAASQDVEAAYAEMKNNREVAAANTPEAGQEQKAISRWLEWRTNMLVNVGRMGELNPEALDRSLN